MKNGNSAFGIYSLKTESSCLYTIYVDTLSDAVMVSHDDSAEKISICGTTVFGGTAFVRVDQSSFSHNDPESKSSLRNLRQS